MILVKMTPLLQQSSLIINDFVVINYGSCFSSYSTNEEANSSTGGFGLISTVDIMPAAYLAGAAITFKHSPTFHLIWSGQEQLSSHTSIYTSIDDSLQRIHLINTTLEKDLTKYPDILQHLHPFPLPLNIEYTNGRINSGTCVMNTC